MKLTIGIPTYDRPETVLETILKLTSFTNSNEVNILVVDNGSKINLADYLHNKIPLLPNLLIKRFSTNQGFHESFYRLFEECETEYLMTLSDEDYFDFDYLNKVLKILKSESPNLLVVKAKSKLKFLPHTSKRKIPLYSLKGESSYISGLIFKTKPVKERINFFRTLSNIEEFAFLYPAVLITFTAALSGTCLLLKGAGIKIGASVSSKITSRDGNAFYLPTERVYQYVSLINCLNHLELEYVNHSQKIKVIRLAARLNFFGSIYDAIGIISPKAQKDIILSGLKTNMIFSYLNIFKRIKL